MISDEEFERLLKRVIEDIPIKNEKFVYGISFVGPPGIGKSTISSILSKKLNVYVTANDKIRRILDEEGIDGENSQPLVERLAYARTGYMLENNTSMIIDANCLTAYNAVEENFSNYNVTCLFIKLECSEEEVLRRLDEREKTFGKDKNNFSRATRKDYDRYKERLAKNPFPEEKVFFVINTEENIESQTDELVAKIEEYIRKNNKKTY